MGNFYSTATHSEPPKSIGWIWKFTMNTIQFINHKKEGFFFFTSFQKKMQKIIYVDLKKKSAWKII